MLLSFMVLLRCASALPLIEEGVDAGCRTGVVRTGPQPPLLHCLVEVLFDGLLRQQAHELPQRRTQNPIVSRQSWSRVGVSVGAIVHLFALAKDIGSVES